MKKQKEWFLNISIVTFSFLLTFTFLEIFLRVSGLATDVAFVEGDQELGIKFIPNQTGTYVVGAFGGNKARYQINSDGWNATRDFKSKRDPGTIRIAVIGDSYVEAFQVPPEEAMSAVLEKNLLRYFALEVYPFGISGASLSQYMAKMRYVRNRFNPDLYIINIVHKDFPESLTSKDRTILQSIRTTGEGFEVVKPITYQPSPVRRIFARSAVVRYLFVNLKLGFKFEQLVRNLTHRAEDVKQTFEANVDVTQTNLETIKEAVSYIFKNYLQEVEGEREKLLLVMDSERNSIYEGVHPKNTRAFQYNKIFSEVCNELSLYCIDLTEQFWSDFRQNKRWFNSKIDGHWNTYGHSVAANQIEIFLLKNGFFNLSKS